MIKEKDYAKYLAEVRRSCLRWQTLEQRRFESGAIIHGIYDLKIPGYNKHFEMVLPNRGFEEVIETMPNNIAVLDAFAPSSFIRDLSIKTGKIGLGVALALNDYRTVEEKLLDEELNIIQLKNADVYTSRFWIDDVNAHLAKFSKSKFDVIVCSPYDGWEILDKNYINTSRPDPILVWLVTQKLWKLLSNDYGLMYVQFPIKDNNLLQEWFSKMKRSGIIVDNTYSTTSSSALAKLIKTKKSPINIPIIPGMHI